MCFFFAKLDENLHNVYVVNLFYYFLFFPIFIQKIYIFLIVNIHIYIFTLAFLAYITCYFVMMYISIHNILPDNVLRRYDVLASSIIRWYCLFVVLKLIFSFHIFESKRFIMAFNLFLKVF